MRVLIAPLWLAPPDRLPSDLASVRRAATSTDAPYHEKPEVLPNAHEAEFDGYFGIARSPFTPELHLTRALEATVANIRALPEAASEPTLGEALETVGLPSRTPAGIPTDPPPQERWIHGHRLFFALTQAAIVGLRQVCEHPQPHAVSEGADAAETFLRASAGAMRLTASFSRGAYERTVRPSMEPPQHPTPGFSGLWSADHRVLVGHLRRSGQPLAGAAHRRARLRLRSAVDEVYAAHVGICERFVGHRPSVLGGSGDALTTLGRLASARSRLLAPPP